MKQLSLQHRNTPMINPKIEDRGIVAAICLVSSLLTFIDPKSVNDICLAAFDGSLPFIIIVRLHSWQKLPSQLIRNLFHQTNSYY